MEKPKFEKISAEKIDEKEKGGEREKEKALSPEVIEKIMEKVQDINLKGTAYHALGAFYQRDPLGKLFTALHEGILGSSFGFTRSRKNAWAEATRKRENVHMCFNIVGRSRGFKNVHDQTALEIKKSYWWVDKSVGIIFDLAPFSEIAPLEYELGGERKVRTFWSADEWTVLNWARYFSGLRPGDPKILESPEFEGLKGSVIDADGKPMSSTELGFELFPRVAPRYFTGIVVGRDLGGIKSFGAHGNSVELEREIIQAMKEANILIPVYDENGNLLWPKPMWYEDVKKFVLEREKKKKTKE